MRHSPRDNVFRLLKVGQLFSSLVRITFIDITVIKRTFTSCTEPNYWTQVSGIGCPLA
jgi:hypothetical protein